MNAFKGINHIIVAFTLYLSVQRFSPFKGMNIGTFVIGLFWLVVASILADVDHPKSLVSSFLILPLFTVFSGHRRETHSLMALIVSSLIFWIYEPFYGFCFSLGYFSHLLVDSLTVSGVPWLYGITDKNYSFKLCKTGSLGEYGVVFLCIQYIFFRLR